MLRKPLALTITIMAFLTFHSCSLPTSVEIRANPEISLPVDVGTGDLGDAIMDAIRDAISENGDMDAIKILRYSGFFLEDAEIETILIQYNILDRFKLDFFDGLDNALLDALFSVDTGDLSHEFDLGDLGDLGDTLEPVEVSVPISNILTEIDDRLNSELDALGPSEDLPLIIGQGVGGLGLPPELIARYVESLSATHAMDIFESITFASGIIRVEFEISPSTYSIPSVPGGDLSGANVTFSHVEISDRDGGNVITGRLNGSPLVQLTEQAPRVVVDFDLANATLKNDFRISARGYDPATSGGTPRFINLSITPLGIVDPRVYAVEGFNFQGADINFGTDHIIPLDAFDGLQESGFLHATIESGHITLEIERPTIATPGVTWFDIDFTTSLHILQSEFPDTHGNLWPGLSERTGATGDPSRYWAYTAGGNNLNGKHINPQNITILASSRVIIPAGRASFRLSADDARDDSLTVRIVPALEINSFEYVHISAANIRNIPAVDPIPLGNASDYLRWIHFDKAGVRITFGRVDIDGLEITLSEPNLGINYPSPVYKPIVENTTIDFISENRRVVVRDGGFVLNELDFTFDLRLGGGSEVIQLRNPNFARDSFKFEVLNIEFIYNWSEAMVDLSSLGNPIGGSFPGDNEDGIDLSAIRDVLDGFTFHGVQAFLYINGPERFFDFRPDILMEVWDGGNQLADLINLFDPELFDNDGKLSLVNSAILNLDPEGTGEFSGTLPGGGIRVNFASILNELPSDLRFAYDITLDEILITRDMLEAGVADETLNVSVVLVVPMSLTAGDQGARVIFPDMFEGQDDIFDRNRHDDLSVLDHINRLNLSVELTHDIFTGGELFFRRAGEAEGDELLRFPFEGRILDISITGEMLDSINSVFPYTIEEAGIRVHPSESLRIPANLGALRIEFDAEIQYRFNF